MRHMITLLDRPTDEALSPRTRTGLLKAFRRWHVS